MFVNNKLPMNIFNCDASKMLKHSWAHSMHSDLDFIAHWFFDQACALILRNINKLAWARFFISPNEKISFLQLYFFLLEILHNAQQTTHNAQLNTHNRAFGVFFFVQRILSWVRRNFLCTSNMPSLSLSLRCGLSMESLGAHAGRNWAAGGGRQPLGVLRHQGPWGSWGNR